MPSLGGEDLGALGQAAGGPRRAGALHRLRGQESGGDPLGGAAAEPAPRQNAESSLVRLDLRVVLKGQTFGGWTVGLSQVWWSWT